MPKPVISNQLPVTSYSPETLLPTEKIIELAKNAGVNFGPGNPQERIRYFIKLGLLPHAVRKIPQADSLSIVNCQLSIVPTGHLPYWTIKRLTKIDRLFHQGISYPKIAQKLKKIDQRKSQKTQKLTQRSPKLSKPIAQDVSTLEKLRPEGFLTRIAVFFAIILLLAFGATTFSLIIGGQKTQQFLQIATPTPQEEVTQKEVLGVKDSAQNFFDKIYQTSSDIASLVLRPLTNLVMVMIYGSDWYVEYQLAIPPSQTPSADIDSEANYLTVSPLGNIAVPGNAEIEGTLTTDYLTTNYLTVASNATLGTKFTDYIQVNGAFESDLLPKTTAKYNLGSGAERWRTGYFSDNLYIGEENRIGSDGLTVKGSAYINTTDGGSIYLDSDSGTLYLGTGTNKLSNADAGTALTIDPAGSGRVQFHSASYYIDENGALTVSSCNGCGGTLTVQEDGTTVDSAVTTIDFLGSDFDITSSPAGEANIALATSGVTAGSYGSASAIPVLTVDAKGRITSASTASISTSSAWSALTDPTTFLSLSFDAGETNTFTTSETTGTFFTYTGTSFTTGEILDITGTWAPTDGSDNEAIDINLTYTPTTSAGTFRGIDLNVTEGANALANTDYALKVTMDNSANTSTGTHSIYGGYFSATGKTAGTTTAYGIYATASGADTNYAGYFAGDILTTGDVAVNGGDVTTTASTLNLTVADGGVFNFVFGANTLFTMDEIISYGGVDATMIIASSTTLGSGLDITLATVESSDNNNGVSINASNPYTRNYLLEIEGSGATTTNGILFAQTDWTMTDAIDASTANITNALNVGGNFILFDDDNDGSGIREFSSAEGVLTWEDTSGNDLCTLTDAGTTGNLSCTGNITGASTGTVGYWSRSSTTLSPATSGDVISLGTLDAGDTGISMTLANLTAASSTGISITNGSTATSGTATGFAVTIGSAGASTTQNGLLITPPASTGAGTTNGINIGSITTSNGTDTAIKIGTGWDYDLLFVTDATHTIKVQDQDTAATAGSFLQILGATGNTTGAGGAISLTSGAGGNTTSFAPGAGGALNITSGAGGDTTTGNDGGTGGAITLTGGTGGDSTVIAGAGGSITLAGGTGGAGTDYGSVGGAGGNINITAGAAGSGDNGGGAGGDIIINGGAGESGSPAGPDGDVILASLRGNVGIGDTTPDAKFDIDSSTTSGIVFGITSTGVQTSGDLVNWTANSLTTADVLDISATALTSGVGIKFTGPSGATAGITGSGISVTSNLGNAGELLNLVGTIDVTTTGASSAGISNVISDSSVLGTTVSQTHYGIYNTLTKSGADTTSGTINLYGTYSTAQNTGGDAAATRNTYGGYFSATGDTSGTTTAYGIYATASGADTNYAGYFATGNTAGVSIISDLSGGARSTDVLTISQANNATYNSTGNLLQLTNSDTGSTTAVLDISQVSSGTAIDLNSAGTGIIWGGTTLGFSVSVAAIFNSGVGISFGGTGIGNVGSFTGDYIRMAPVKTQTGGSINDTGNFLDLTRSNTINNGSSTFTVSGDLATFSSNCTQTAGTCTDTSNILSLTQSYSSASGAVLEITNAGTGNAIEILGAGTRTINSTSGNLTISTTTSGSLTLNAAATNLNLQNDGSVDVNIAGGSGATGWTITNASGALTGDGSITTSGAVTINGNNDLRISGTGRLVVGDADTDAQFDTDGMNTHLTSYIDGGRFDFTVENGSGSGRLALSVGYDSIQINNVNDAGSSGTALYLTGTLSNFDGDDTFRGIYLDYTNGTHSGSDNILNAIDIATLASPSANATETAINIGSGWDYGVVIPLAGTYALQLSDTGGTAASGITFGTDTNLYRSGNLTLTSNATTFNCTDCIDFDDIAASMTLDGAAGASSLSIGAGYTRGITITSGLSGGSRTADVLTISQANNATYNSTGNLLQLTNSDLGSAAALLDISNAATGSTAAGIDFSSAAGSAAGIKFSSIGSSGIYFPNTLASGQSGILFDTSYTSAFAGNAIDISGNISGVTGEFTGKYINVAVVKYATSATLNDTGNFINVSRYNGTVDTGQTGGFNITGDLVTFSSGCDPGATGTCTDTSNILSLAQNYSSASGAVIEITNVGTGADIDFNSTSPSLTLDDGGTFTIENASGTDFLAASATAFNINLSDTATYTELLCHNGADGATGVQDIGDCNTAGGGDLAENFGSSGDLEPGDLVMLDPERPAYELDMERLGLVSKAYVIKTSESYKAQTLGVVSTNPNKLVLLSDKVFAEDEHPVPIALSGRVPVKVNSENGPVKVGDFITSSSTPGVGMKATKAGRVVGVALEGFEGSEIGKIIVFVNPTFYLGENLASNGSFSPQLSQTEQNAATVNNELLTDNLLNPDGTLISTLDGQILTSEQIRHLIADEVTRQLASSQLTVNGSQTTNTVNSEPITVNQATASASSNEATGSATTASDANQLTQETSQTLADLDKLLNTQDAVLSTLRVTGNSQLAQTQIAGTFSQDGTLIIDYGRQINVLGSTLHLQNDSLSGNTLGILLDVGAGVVIIDKQGNLKIKGTLSAQKVETQDIVINTSDDTAKTVGSSQIPANQQKVTISTTAVKPNAKILVTPTTATGGRTLYIAGKVEFEGFTVSLDPASPTPTPIDFDWLIVNTTNLSNKTN